MATFEKQGAVGVVRARSPIDSGHCEALKEAARGALTGGRPMLVIDLHEAPLIDSAGLEALVELRQQFESRGGGIKLSSVNPLCAEILRITGVGDLFEQYAQSRQAVGSFAE